MAKNVLVTPPGREVLMDPKTRTLRFPAIEEWVEMDAKAARATAPNQIGPPNLAELIESEEGIVDVAAGHSLRLGVGFALVINGRVTAGMFDAGHRTRPEHLTPAAGIFEAGDPGQEAVRELSEEMISRTDNEVGVWVVEGMPVMPERSQEYAEHHGLRFNPDFRVPVQFATSDLHWTIYFGDRVYRALIEWEPDTSSCEIIFVGLVSAQLPEDFRVVDGERLDFLPGAPWRNSNVVTEGHEGYKQTTKMEIVLAAWRAGLRPAE